MNEPLSFYVHIPYCVKRCGYCDFNTYTPSELREGGDIKSVSNGYIDQLLKEIGMATKVAPPNSPVPTIFFGGGTPTLMEPADLGLVLMEISNEFGFAKDIEITIEANPDTVTKEKLAALRAVGMNRISFGMQSAAPHVLAVLDRTHNPENVIKATNWAREVGFDEVSVDLIYGAPTETIQDWQATLNAALELPITHISAYALIVEAGTKLANQVKRGEVIIPDDDQTADKYMLADESFSKAGFDWYELSNWSKPGSQAKHNLAYWKNANWWGLGPGAHSHINGMRFWNVKHPTAYKERIENELAPVQDSETLTQEQKENERIMLEIRLREGIALDSLGQAQIDRLKNYLSSDHLDATAWQGGRVVLTLTGRLIADRIVQEIIS
ncbi:MAG: radical SAM family heme chaperone HemW [Actinobacteria bacterium]|jgi:oxygen-independent coproporphyrinogen-3 oxidase|nr:radical SAM family heme chaperone HemW [Actinomycetota bacterium]